MARIKQIMARIKKIMARIKQIMAMIKQIVVRIQKIMARIKNYMPSRNVLNIIWSGARGSGITVWPEDFASSTEYV